MKTLKLISMFTLLIMIAGCATKQPEPQVDIIEEEPVIVSVPEVPEIPEVSEEEPEEIEDEMYAEDFLDEPEIIIFTDDQDEYARSLGEIDASEISEELFIEDKEEILSIINELEQIMRKKDYPTWVTYLEENSRAYWSDAHNLTVLSAKLPGGGLVKLKSLKDYFEKFFIPARKGRIIDEIRYVTTDLVKAVQYKDNEDITTYLFTRVNGQWKLTLDTSDVEE